MAEFWLVCEGRTDYDVLSPVFTRIIGCPIVVEPGNGIGNLASIALYLRRTGGVAAYLEDRDHRPRQDAVDALNDGTPRFLLSRHCIENYLLEPEIVHRAFRSLTERFARAPHAPPKWVQRLPATSQEIRELISQCAAAMVPQEAGCMVIDRLWRSARESLGRIQKRLPPLLNQATPADSPVCRQAVLDEGQRLADTCRDAAALSELEPTSLGTWYDDERDRCTAAAEVNSLECLIDFNGKRLMARMLADLQSQGINLSLKQLQTLCADELVNAYDSHRLLFGDDEFQALAEAIQRAPQGPLNEAYSENTDD